MSDATSSGSPPSASTGTGVVSACRTGSPTMRIGTTAMTGKLKSADSRGSITTQHQSPWLNIAETKWNVPQCCEVEDCRKGPESEMDGAIARTGKSGDSEDGTGLTDGLTRREHDILAFE